MTAAQKENIKRFKAVQAEAKKLKAKNKKLTHQEAVKQAWAIMYSKQRKAAPKKAAKKVGAVKKKAAPKKKTAVRNYGSHKDTHSHNVKISVMSGHLVSKVDIERQMTMFKNLKEKVKEAEKKYKTAKDSLNKFYAKQQLDRLKMELRERKFVASNLYKQLNKII